MTFLSKLIRFWSNLFRHRQMELDLNDELQAYVEEMVDRKIQAGVPPEAAREIVLLELGGIDRIKDLTRRERIGFRNPSGTGMIVVAILLSFTAGASVAVGVMRWRSSVRVAQTAALKPEIGGVSRERTAALEGLLVDRTTGQPISGVEIGLRESPMRRHTYTDDTGHFFFSNPPAQFYWLEAGTQRWTINQGSPVLPPCVASKAFGDFFELSPSNSVLVKSKDGQPQNGERMDIGGKTFLKLNPVSLPELRRFRYSDSMVELQAVNLSPGTVEGMEMATPAIERVR